jgi:hypothetical protein
MSPKNVLASVLLVFMLISCKRDPLRINIQGVNTGISFVNLDSLLLHTDHKELSVLNQKCKKDLGDIYSYEVGYCIKLADDSDSSFQKGIRLFLKDPYVQRLEERISQHFGNLSAKKREIDDGFKHLKVHFPHLKMPKKIVFMNSLFVSSAFSTENEIGIGLERYLGSKVDVIKELPYQTFPEWEKEAMDEQYVSRDALASWIATHLAEEVDGNLAEKMVRWGKVLYLTQAAFPEKDPSFIMRYSKKDYNWALENEYALWNYLADEKLLFKIDELNIKNLLGEGPFTPGLPEKGPDRLGQFLGYRIILKYMEIRDVSLDEMLKASYSDILVEYEID